ncbi:hypothetical protein B0J11DRAFT_606213 [Dendryphion nanum]|uniref:Uncharacterized protein n=1 Tax=Dendryphion nanum TaxID=256645 RepID=A0A9P9DUX2_9PLEO|nr:hypothetical protein B0J11DRAFT_606213 [Dendryphion nanum]
MQTTTTQGNGSSLPDLSLMIQNLIKSTMRSAGLTGKGKGIDLKASPYRAAELRLLLEKIKPQTRLWDNLKNLSSQEIDHVLWNFASGLVTLPKNIRSNTEIKKQRSKSNLQILVNENILERGEFALKSVNEIKTHIKNARLGLNEDQFQNLKLAIIDAMKKENLWGQKSRFQNLDSRNTKLLDVQLARVKREHILSISGCQDDDDLDRVLLNLAVTMNKQEVHRLEQQKLRRWKKERRE